MVYTIEKARNSNKNHLTFSPIIYYYVVSLIKNKKVPLGLGSDMIPLKQTR